MIVEGTSIDNPDILILGPGGFKGFMLIGFLDYLSRYTTKLNNLSIICGVSIGAIISLFLTIGYQPNEIFFILLELMNLITRSGDLSSFNNFFNKKGLLSWEPIIEFIEDKVSDKIGTVPTLNGLYKITSISLVIVGYNLENETKVYFDKNNYPDLSCVHAVCCSMAFPLLFSPFKINKLNYIDGGLGDAIPIHYFHDNKHNILSIMMTSNDNYKEKESLFSYIDRLSSSIVKSSIKNCIIPNENVDFILLETSVNISPLDLTQKDHIYTMVKEGYDCGKNIELYRNKNKEIKSYKYNYDNTIQNSFLNKLNKL